jgi:hypothetical protein
MQIYIDESGSFAGFERSDLRSLAAVGALCIPNGRLAKLCQNYDRLRRRLPKENGEVKGRILSEEEIAAVVGMLAKNDVLLELSVTDVGAHRKNDVARYRDELAAHMEAMKPKFSENAQGEVASAVAQIRATPPQLFLQAILTMDVLERVIQHVPLYYSQRQPRELGSFEWIVDSKERNKTIEWERWWSTYCIGVLAARSRARPAACLEGADYSHYDASFAALGSDNEATDLRLLLSNFRFSSDPEIGLELIDILTNAVRRALVGNLGSRGWRDVPRLMIHRPEHYVGLMTLAGASSIPERPSYAERLLHFTAGGKNMLSPRFLREADAAAE